MLKESYHPNAYLPNLRNVILGLRARTRILSALEKGPSDAKTIASRAELHYGVTLHHLKLLQLQGIVRRGSERPAVWVLTGAGQRRLVSTS